MKKILRYLNPIAHLGDTHYSILFPLVTTVAAAVLIEAAAYLIFHNPNAVGLAAIFVFITLIVYFAFREGIRGGVIAASVTVVYYFYIIFTRKYSGQQLQSGIETTVILGLLYLIIGWIIGWLKQTIDAFIEREANEKRRLTTILQQLPVGVVVTDADGKVVFANKQIEVITGRKTRSKVIAGKDTVDYATYRGKKIAPSQWPIAQTLATRKAVTGKEIVIEQQNGKRKHVQVSASLIHNRAGKVIAAASIFNDITHQKEMEERKDDFVNMASHELKTPITSLKLYTDSLKKRIQKHEDKAVTKTIDGITDQTDRLQGLVSDLLDVSRLQTGKLIFTKEPIVLDEVIDEVLKELKATLKKRKVTFVRKSSPMVTADKFRIYQVLTNLITNANKYSPEDTEIIITVKKAKHMALVSIKDSGIGIPKDQQKKIFDRLYQVTESKEKTFPGLGMGLYIVKEIIKKHKGDIWVESSVGKGSTFYFTLPLK